MNMSKKGNKSFPTWAMALVGLGIFAVVIAVLFGLFVAGTYNSLVGLDEGVNNAWGGVQSAYQRRADLVPGLVATVRQYSDYEGEVLTEITQARASIGSAQTPSELQSAGADMNSAIARLLVVVENYPNLKANEQYLDLMAQLEGTENRIKIERDLYNGAVRSYNTKVRMFPSSIVAGMMGFPVKEYFAAAEGSDVAPDVDELFDR
jgi:LemA protein